MSKKRRCDNSKCGKMLEVLDDLEDYIPVFCNERCSRMEQDLDEY